MSKLTTLAFATTCCVSIVMGPVAYANTNQKISPNILPSWSDSEPATINVLMQMNNPATVQKVNFASYCKDVLAWEWGPKYPSGGPATVPQSAYDAGAIAVRGFSWYYSNHPESPGYYDIGTGDTYQVYQPGTYSGSSSATQNGVTQGFSDTKGLAIQSAASEPYGPQYICHYQRGSYGTSRTSSSYSWNNYMMQLGTSYLGNVQGKNWQYMVGYYWPGTSVVGSGANPF